MVYGNPNPLEVMTSYGGIWFKYLMVTFAILALFRKQFRNYTVRVGLVSADLTP